MRRNTFLRIVCIFSILFLLCGCKGREFRKNCDECFKISEQLFTQTSKVNALAVKHFDELAYNLGRAYVDDEYSDDDAYDRFFKQIINDRNEYGLSDLELELIVYAGYIEDYDGNENARQAAIKKIITDVLAYSRLYTNYYDYSIIEMTKGGMSMQPTIKKELDDYRKEFIEE